MDPALFFQPLAVREHPELGDIVRREVENLMRGRDAKSLLRRPSDCLFSSIQAYLSLLMCLLPRLADRLAHGSHVTDYINDQIAIVDDDTDFSDLEPLNILNERQRILQEFVARIRQFSAEFDDTKGHTPLQAEPSPPHQPSQCSAASLPVLPVFPGQAGSIPLVMHPGPTFEMPDRGLGHSPPIEIPAVEFRRYSPQRVSPTENSAAGSQKLVRRGKGVYRCPHLQRCTKGGVEPDGTMVVFERNSAFRAHLQKHERPFKCDLQGCTNKEGFARIDQLRRHQERTRHG